MRNEKSKCMNEKCLFLFGVLFLLLSACTSIDCPVQNLVYTVYRVYDGEQPDTLGDTLTVKTLRANGKDTILLNHAVRQTVFELPVSYQRPVDTLVFCFSDTLGVKTFDTVWVKKQDIPHFESVDCSANFFHELEAVRSTHQRIDTITINRTSVDYDLSVAHFLIRFKARP